MTDVKKQDVLYDILRVIPASLRYRLETAVFPERDKIQDIVLRASRPVCVYIGAGQYYVTQSGVLTDSPHSDALTASVKDVNDCFNVICGFSVYSHMSEIREGFVTIKGGHRAAIAGTAVMKDDEIINIRDISSVSLRISRQIIGCGKEVADIFSKLKGGVLICGSPSSGKTTVLRDVSRLLSTRFCLRTALIDSRGELASVTGAVPQNNVGLCDVFDGYPRYQGIMQALRLMSPEVIICDEIASDSDAAAIIQGINSGVRFVATVHASDTEELKNKSAIYRLLQYGAFESVIFLRGRDAPGIIDSIYPMEVITDA